MSGIFKYTPNRAAASTPNRRSAFGVTGFGRDIPSCIFHSMGFRSPSMSALAGQTSPAQGRSLREYEEQMSALRKENFNLKLRIYFLEENAGLTAGHATSPTTADGNTSGGTPESLIKQNIDLKADCGSPSHQNDATMDNSYSMGFRSPSMSALAGQTSPAQGRSLREYEEQMSALRKENFNLKLRIYFLEENAGLTAGHATSPTTADGNTSGGTPESLIKQNIDLKVELESLRKDLQEKQDLLLQAGKAMDLMEESSRKAQDHNREIIDDLEHRLELLHHEIKQMEQAERQQQQQANMTRSRLNETGVSGSLPVDRRKAMRKAVDRSLDLSRSLNMSISVTGFSLPESSLAHLSCLSGYLDAGEDSLLEANKENRADESVGSVAKVIETLKAENRELRGQLAGHNKKDVRRKIIPALAEPLSDSEAWSEPDRDVSQARIGLEERTSLPNSASKVKSVVTRGGVLQELSSTSENENVGYLKKHTAELKQLQETVGTLTGALQEKDSKILDVQSRLVDLDNKLQEERMKASRMQAELENTRQVNQRLEKENGVQQDRSKSNEKRLEELTREIQQKDEVLEKLRKEREQAFVDLRVAVMKLDNLRTEHQEVQQKHKDQIETLLAQERQRLEDLRRDLSESFNSQLKAKQASFEASLSESYISKNIHQEKLQELQEVMFRLDDTEMQLLGMSEDQARLKKQLQDAETAVQSMRKTLDETTLQASKAAIERTKALNEKRQLEDELKHCQDDLRATKEEKNALNAKLQEIQGQLQLATQQRTPPKRLNSSSGAEGSIASGYTSEELLLVAGRPAKPERTSRPENSSPDLGIESDAGRHSHTESQAPPPAPSPARPLLKTLELTRSMSNLLMEPKEEAIQELNPTSATMTTPPHDCAKIEADYAELKRRYKQTRRHLELAYDSIKSANRRKERLEQDIKQQIQKTNVVLKTVRTNMTNELEKSPSGGEVRKSVP
ncbi:centrosomin [Culex quinquefasciatus]|uniref:Centrosomin n=1 Tax=Culex quinquefasciatus TaxID=7176 RepID=B0WY54_CULQU|nr:centrosomin [Culex quinquefasciatus]|eukprot:XP_001862326.1 centrosomin [Culex quinquefasciatus]